MRDSGQNYRFEARAAGCRGAIVKCVAELRLARLCALKSRSALINKAFSDSARRDRGELERVEVF
ncbi:hypothetical protein PSAB6_490023 [Paraburkholderia sabiae]|nr:hypothetical protein PSAB6_490023 [Paraburkholderia sabiae]